MKVWGIFATILFLAFAGLSGYLYYERDSLIKEKNQLASGGEQNTDQVKKVTGDLQLLDEFVEDDFSKASNERADLTSKIEELNSRNLSVAYENYVKASSKEKLAASQIFFSEFINLLLADVNAQKAETQTSEEDKTVSETEQIEGEGNYSNNIFP